MHRLRSLALTASALAALTTGACNLDDPGATPPSDTTSTSNNTSASNNTSPQDMGGDEECSPESCGDFGTCSIVDGAISCACDTGYDGDACDACAAGFQDNDTNGTCAADCAAAQLDCGDVGACDDSSGAAICACDTGYSGPTCAECAAGFQDSNGDGTCLADCAANDAMCGENGSCALDSGIAVCSCDEGYTGVVCDACADGFQDNDANGTCSPTCATAALGCSGKTVCDDTSGEATCACGPGDPCVQCPAGQFDDDGNGTCTPACAESEWFEAAYRNRVALEFEAPTALEAGTFVTLTFDHKTDVTAGRSLPSGRDVRVVFQDASQTLKELTRAPVTEWNSEGTTIAFALATDVSAGSRVLGYWLYWNNASAGEPMPIEVPPAPAQAIADDGGETLVCARQRAGFISVQLRQLDPSSPTQYEVWASERTRDTGSFGRVTITDSAGRQIFDKTYRELGGSCCPAVDRTAADSVTITDSRFTVEMESDEFSSSSRFFGCTRFTTGSGQPPGVTTRSYTVVAQERPAARTCAR